jgi:uncharacterized protein
VERLRIEISSDGLTAALHVTAGPAADAEALPRALQQSRIGHGLDAEALGRIAAALADPTYQGRTEIARGTPARAGQDGRIELHWPVGLVPGSGPADGPIDFRERHFLQPVPADSVCARIIHPTAAVPGRSVLGTVLTAPHGRPPAARPGPGLRQQGDQLIAVRGGALVCNGPSIDVVPLFVHGADVDYRSGNLHTEGALVVRGDVREGFAATATEAVQVTGAVLDATVRGVGAVRIEQGVMGQRSLVVASGDLWCRHATAATLQAGGTLTFGDGASHCRATATNIHAHAGRGTVFGGELRASRRIEVGTAGREHGTATLLAVADLTYANADMVRNTLGPEKLAERARLRARGQGPHAGKSLRTAARLGDVARDERLRLRQQQRELLGAASIVVHDTLHVGVRLCFGDHHHTVDDRRHHVRLRWNPDTDRLHEETLP